VEIVIRPAVAADVGRLGAVERDGDRRFGGDSGVPPGFDEVTEAAALAGAVGDGRLWVATTPTQDGPGGAGSDDGTVIGFALADIIDGQGHLAQVSVRLAFQGRGVGGRLVETVCRWAMEHSLASVTLCTFADVAWNRPLYEHLGFEVVPPDRWTPGLRAVFAGDGDLGLDLERRVVMRRRLDTD